jgi:hypothetical protein
MIFIPLTVSRVPVKVVLKEPFLGWRRNYERRLKSSWTGDSAPLLCRGRHNSVTAANCRQSTSFSNDCRINFIKGITNMYKHKILH